MQENIFLASEADNWYIRNRDLLLEVERKGITADIKWLIDQLTPFKGELKNVLELGCGNGAKLRMLCQGLGIKGLGIDASNLAVQEGNAIGGVDIRFGVISELPFDTHSFDFVHFGFCLYVLDRSKLLAAVAEADRVLKPGGFMAITDFDPLKKHKRPYHHCAGIFTYKQNYVDCFVASGLYTLVGKNSFSHMRTYFDIDADERISTVLLYKEVDAY